MGALPKLLKLSSNVEREKEIGKIGPPSQLILWTNLKICDENNRHVYCIYIVFVINMY